MYSKITSQIKIELTHNLFPLFLVNLIILGIVYFIFGIKNVDVDSQAMVIERFLPLTGTFFITSLFYEEHKSPIKDILRMRSTKIEFIYIIRFLTRLFIYGLISLIYISFLIEAALSNELVKTLFHSLSIGLVVGGIGLFLFSITNNISLAFLSSIGLILAQWFFPKKKVNILLLSTMPEVSIKRILLIFGLSFILIISSFLIWKRKDIS